MTQEEKDLLELNNAVTLGLFYNRFKPEKEREDEKACKDIAQYLYDDGFRKNVDYSYLLDMLNTFKQRLLELYEGDGMKVPTEIVKQNIRDIYSNMLSEIRKKYKGR